MSGAAGYRILDEPRPSGLARYAVNPVWPLFGMMFAGAWFAWLWFLFNGQAIGSPTRKRELLAVAIGFLGLLVLPVLLHMGLVESGWRSGTRYALVAIACWKVGVSYWLYVLQSRSFELYEYYGGLLRSGMIAVVAGYFLQRLFVANLDLPLLRLMLS